MLLEKITKRFFRDLLQSTQEMNSEASEKLKLEKSMSDVDALAVNLAIASRIISATIILAASAIVEAIDAKH